MMKTTSLTGQPQTKKQKEFLFSRKVLRQNLPIYKNHPYKNHKERGYIIWPEGVTGSLTHKKNLVALVTGENPASATYGVDLEEVRVTKKVFERVTKEQEQSLLLSSWPTEEDLTLLYTLAFSMKESLFKAFSQDKEDNYPKVLKDCSLTFFDPNLRVFEGSFGEEKAKGEFFFVDSETKKSEPPKMVLTFCRKEIFRKINPSSTSS